MWHLKMTAAHEGRAMMSVQAGVSHAVSLFITGGEVSPPIKTTVRSQRGSLVERVDDLRARAAAEEGCNAARRVGYMSLSFQVQMQRSHWQEKKGGGTRALRAYVGGRVGAGE